MIVPWVAIVVVVDENEAMVNLIDVNLNIDNEEEDEAEW